MVGDGLIAAALKLLLLILETVMLSALMLLVFDTYLPFFRYLETV